MRVNNTPAISTPAVKHLRILIVDDQQANVRFLECILESAGFCNVESLTDPRKVLASCVKNTPDLILLDLHMPHVSGLSLIPLITAELRHEIYLPILVLTADATSEPRQKALSSGAKDFLAKPLDADEVLQRCTNLLLTRALYKQIESQNQSLEEKVHQRTQELAEAQTEILNRLALAAEYRDDATGQHTKRVGMLAAMLGRAIGLPEDEVELLRLTAPVHDVGKIGIPDRVLLKPGKLTPGEFEIMKSHTTIGGEILGKSRFRVMQFAREIALAHHERWDGMGYPQRSSGELIPLSARITAVVDVFDALTHARPYKEAWPLPRALTTIEQEQGRHFDPKLVTAFVDAIKASGLQKLAEKLTAESGNLSPLPNAIIESAR